MWLPQADLKETLHVFCILVCDVNNSCCLWNPDEMFSDDVVESCFQKCASAEGTVKRFNELLDTDHISAVELEQDFPSTVINVVAVSQWLYIGVFFLKGKLMFSRFI